MINLQTARVDTFLDEQDRVLFEKRLPNSLDVIIKSLKPYSEDLLACVVESTYNWYWLVDGLMDAGFAVRLAHTSAIPQYAGLKDSNAETDARHLAHLLRLGILPEGYIMPREQRAVRDLLRRRLLLVRQRTLHHLSVQSLLARYTGNRLPANQVKALESARIDELLAEPICLGGQITVLAMRWLDKAIDKLEREVSKRLNANKDYDLPIWDWNPIHWITKSVGGCVVDEALESRSLLT